MFHIGKGMKASFRKQDHELSGNIFSSQTWKPSLFLFRNKSHQGAWNSDNFGVLLIYPISWHFIIVILWENSTGDGYVNVRGQTLAFRSGL